MLSNAPIRNTDLDSAYMDPGVLIAAIVTAIVAPLGAYVIAARRFSGQIASSDAEQLWAESGRLRADYQTRIIELSQIVTRLEDRVVVLEDRNMDLVRENEQLHREVRDLNQLIVTLRQRVADLTDELAQARARVDQLEGEARSDPAPD